MAETLDTIFNPNANNNIYGVHRQPDRKTIIVGYFTYLGTIQIHKIARINTDGTIDPAFLSIGMDYFVGIVLYQTITQPDGKILVCGAKITGQQEHVLRRLNSNITLDTSFAPNPNGDVACIYLQADNKIMVGGWFTSIGGVTRNRMARLNSDGTVDTTFINCVFNNPVYSIQQLSDGKYLVGGAFQTVNGVARTGLAVINADGTLYTGFVYNCGGSNTEVVTVYRCADNKFLVAGYFDTIGGVTRNRIARFNADYTIDNTLNLTFTGSYVDGIAQRSNGDIYIGGSFSVINGVGRSNIAVINNDGTLSSTFNIVVNGAIADIIADNEDVTFVGYFTSALAEVRNYGARLASAFLPTGWCGSGSPWCGVGGPWCGVGEPWNPVSGVINPVYISQFGSFGTGDSQFNYPLDLAIDSTRIYVVDSNNNRVQVFNKITGAFIAKFGAVGSGDGQFNSPINVSVDDNYIYVLDQGNYRVQIFNKSTYAFVGKFSYTGTSMDMCIDNDYIYISIYTQKKVLKYNKNTYAYIGEYNSISNWIVTALGISSDNNYLYIASVSSSPTVNRIEVINKQTLMLVTTINTIDGVVGIGSSCGYMYITIAGVSNIVRIYEEFSYVLLVSFGGSGSGITQFNVPYGLVSDDYLYFADTGNNRILKYSNRLPCIESWCGAGIPWGV